MIALNYLAVLIVVVALIVTARAKRFVWVVVLACLFLANVLVIILSWTR